MECIFEAGESPNFFKAVTAATSPQWSELPPLAIENVYSFLNLQDKRRMSLVCRNWHAEYDSPRLWRKMTFQLPEAEYPGGLCPEVLSAIKYGEMFYHVDVLCKRVRTRLLDTITGQLRLFLEAVSDKSKLRTITFSKMKRFFRWLGDETFQGVFQAIESLLRKQDDLHLVEFRETGFKKSEAARLLKLICTKKKIKTLLLNDFVSESWEDSPLENIFVVNPEGYDLESLTDLEMDYSQLFENIVSLLYTCVRRQNTSKKRCLERITLFCDGSKRMNYLGIPSYVWLSIRKLIPNLRINLHFEAGTTVKNAATLFIVKHMPIKSLDFRMDRHSNSPYIGDAGSLLRYLVSCNVNHHLENLTIVWLKINEDLSRDLLAFLQVSPNLKNLQLCISNPVGALQTVLNSWLENRRSLKNVYITVENILSQEEIDNYTNLSEEYAPLLEVLGLNLFLIANGTMRPPRAARTARMQPV